MGNDLFPPGSYSVQVQGNRVIAITRIPDGDELLGIEWAISEVKDAMKHASRADGTYGVADLDELAEFMDFLARVLGEPAMAEWRGRIQP